MQPTYLPSRRKSRTKLGRWQKLAPLFQMGFTDAEMVTLVLEKHGPDLDACARDLSTFSDWGSLLADLQEMGFKDVEKNKRLVVKHNGSLKSTIRELVSGK